MNGRTSTYSTGMYYADILVKKTGVDVSNWYFVNSKDELLELCESNYQNGQSTTIVKTNGFEGEWIDALMNKIYGSVESYDVSEYVIYIININGIK